MPPKSIAIVDMELSIYRCCHAKNGLFEANMSLLIFYAIILHGDLVSFDV